jgi:hypothetical protein
VGERQKRVLPSGEGLARQQRAADNTLPRAPPPLTKLDLKPAFVDSAQAVLTPEIEAWCAASLKAPWRLRVDCRPIWPSPQMLRAIRKLTAAYGEPAIRKLAAAHGEPVSRMVQKVPVLEFDSPEDAVLFKTRWL